jgi:hypothetical protein
MRLSYPPALIALGAMLLVSVQLGASASSAKFTGHSSYEQRRTPSDTFLALDWMNAQRGWALVGGACGQSRCPVVYATQSGPYLAPPVFWPVIPMLGYRLVRRCSPVCHAPHRVPVRPRTSHDD